MSIQNTASSSSPVYNFEYFDSFLNNNKINDEHVISKFEHDILNESKTSLSRKERLAVLDKAVTLLSVRESPELNRIMKIAIEFDLIYNHNTHHFDDNSLGNITAAFFRDNGTGDRMDFKISSIKPLYDAIAEKTSAQTDEEKYAVLKKTIELTVVFCLKDPNLITEVIKETNISDKNVIKLIIFMFSLRDQRSDFSSNETLNSYNNCINTVVENELIKNGKLWESENGLIKDLINDKNESFVSKHVLTNEYLVNKYHDDIKNNCYKLLIMEWGDHSYSKTLDARLELAEITLSKDPNFLSDKLLYLFTEEEIFNTPQIQELMEKLEPRISDEKAKDYFTKIKMYLAFYKTDNGGEKDNPVIRCIGKEETPTGVNWIFRLETVFNVTPQIPRHLINRQQAIENIIGASNLLFPAVVGFDIEAAIDNLWAPILGFKQQTGYSGVYITLPEPSAVEQRWVSLEEKFPKRMKNITRPLAIPVPGTATTEEYNDGVRKGGVIYSTTHEFAHDIVIHYLSTLQAKFSSKKGAFERIQERFIKTHKDTDPIIEGARNKYTSPQELDLLEIIVLSTGIFADLYSAIPRTHLRERLITDWGTGELIKDVWNDPSWRTAYSEIVKDYTADQITEFWLKIQEEFRPKEPAVPLRARL